MTVNEMKLQFCERVRQLRAEKNMSIKQLSLGSGIPLEFLEQLEQNILPEEMMVDDAIDLARAFGCKVYELFE